MIKSTNYRDNGIVRFEFNYSIIQDMIKSWNENLTTAQNSNPPDSQSSTGSATKHPYYPNLPVLLNLSMFSAAMAFFPNKTTTGNATRGPNGDLDGDTLTNYEEYSYNMPDDYNLTKDGPYMGGLNPINPDSDNDGLPDGYEIQYGLDPKTNNKTQDMDSDGLTNSQEYNYHRPSSYNVSTKSILASNSTTFLISVQYLPNGIYWNGTAYREPKDRKINGFDKFK